MAQLHSFIDVTGIKGAMPIGELCNKYEISQGKYYKWQDLLLNGADKMFVANLRKEHSII